MNATERAKRAAASARAYFHTFVRTEQIPPSVFDAADHHGYWGVPDES